MSGRAPKNELDNALPVFDPDGITLGEFQEIRQGDECDPNPDGNGSEASSATMNNEPIEPIQDVSWKKKATCREYPNKSIFFSTSERKVAAAKAICEMCPVRGVCLEYAVENGIRHGMWGGVEQRYIRKMIVAKNKAK